MGTKEERVTIKFSLLFNVAGNLEFKCHSGHVCRQTGFDPESNY